MNPLLIRHRLFSVLLKDLVSADMFDQPQYKYYKDQVSKADSYFTPRHEQMRDAMVRNPDCNFDINMFHNDDFVIKKAGDLSKHEEAKQPEGVQFSIKRFKEDA